MFLQGHDVVARCGEVDAEVFLVHVAPDPVMEFQETVFVQMERGRYQSVHRVVVPVIAIHGAMAVSSVFSAFLPACPVLVLVVSLPANRNPVFPFFESFVKRQLHEVFGLRIGGLCVRIRPGCCGSVGGMELRSETSEQQPTKHSERLPCMDVSCCQLPMGGQIHACF